MEALRSYFGPPVGLSRPRGFSSFLSGRNYRLGGASKWSPPARLTPPPWRPLRCAPSALPLDVSPPPIDGDPELKATEGAALEHCTAETFGDDNAAIDAAFNGVAIMDLSHFGRLRVTGKDRFHFLHNQSTANFECLTEGEGCDTVFVTATARTIDIAYVWVMKNAILLLVSPSTSSSIAEMLNKYIFYADKVEVHDITHQTCFFALIGPKSNQVMEALNLGDIVEQPYGTHRHYNVNGAPLTIGIGSILSRDGFSFMLSPASARSVWRSLLSHGAIPMGANAWERLRVLKGRPAPGKELTKDYNVLEAGLSMAVHLDKGCYKGQETISRLITYNGVKQRLWGIKLSGQAAPGTSIMLDGKKVGVLTSYALGRRDGEHLGLGYAKRHVTPADEVFIGDVKGTLVDVPLLSYTKL
ncbi:putative transferase At1g60990, chloroplastic isoform X1 [Musa acuminata AAA Group]|uniref:putative transferase At1g60990, chloroplastic isoform X1 n=1 Tax=Musa acuminata AAA Group TaxID=214697 RepID=UPI0031DC135B